MAGDCCPTCGNPDINRAGAVGTDADIAAFFAALSGGGPSPYPASLSDNRFGWRGYWWDDHLKLYHVRHSGGCMRSGRLTESRVKGYSGPPLGVGSESCSLASRSE
jgi:hypothetical protein